jgi:hypothetical protein
MTDARRLWTRRSDARSGFEAVVGGDAIVGDDDADPRVARIIDIDPDGNIELEVLDGTVEAHLDLVAPRLKPTRVDEHQRTCAAERSDSLCIARGAVNGAIHRRTGRE